MTQASTQNAPKFTQYIMQGILLAIALSILAHTRHGYKPKNALIKLDSAGKLHAVSVSSHAQYVPGLMIYRFHHSLYYANAELFSREVSDLVNTAQPSLSWLCMDFAAVDDIDFTAAATLKDTYHLLAGKGIRLVLSEVDEDVRHELDLSGISSLIGKEAYFEVLSDVEAAYSKEDALHKS